VRAIGVVEGVEARVLVLVAEHARDLRAIHRYRVGVALPRAAACRHLAAREVPKDEERDAHHPRVDRELALPYCLSHVGRKYCRTRGADIEDFVSAGWR